MSRVGSFTQGFVQTTKGLFQLVSEGPFTLSDGIEDSVHIGGSGGGGHGHVSTPRSNFFHFRVVLGKFFPGNRLTPSPSGLAPPPPSGKSWIRNFTILHLGN